MREWMMEQGMIFYFFCAVGVMGAAAAALANRTYKRLIKEADGMENSQHRLIKYIKLKYSSYYTLGMKANDEQAMVRRYLYRYKLGPMTLIAWSKAGLLAMGAVIAVSFGNILYGLSAGTGFRAMLSMTVFGLMVASILAIQYKLYSFSDKQKIFCAQMEDNLQNFLKNKIEYGHVLKRHQQESDEGQSTEATEGHVQRNKSDVFEKPSQAAAYAQSRVSEEPSAERLSLRERTDHSWKSKSAGERQAAAAACKKKKQAKSTDESVYTKAALQLADGFGPEEIDARVVEDILKEFLN